MPLRLRPCHWQPPSSPSPNQAPTWICLTVASIPIFFHSVWFMGGCQCPSDPATGSRPSNPSPNHWQGPTWTCLTNHSCLVPNLSIDSLYALTVSALFKIVLTGGLHGASHSSLWASLRGQSDSCSDSTLNPSRDSPHHDVRTIHVHAHVHTNIWARAP